MKSSALHLLTFLLLGLLHVLTNNNFMLFATTAAAVTSVYGSSSSSSSSLSSSLAVAAATTTTQLPSLRAPRHYRATTAVVTDTTSSLPPAAALAPASISSEPIANRRHKQQHNSRQLTARQPSVAHANFMANNKNNNNNNDDHLKAEIAAMATSSSSAMFGGDTTFESVRLVRDAVEVAESPSASVNGIRQNRSFQTRPDDDNNNNNNNNALADTPTKYNRIERRQQRQQQIRTSSQDSTRSSGSSSNSHDDYSLPASLSIASGAAVHQKRNENHQSMSSRGNGSGSGSGSGSRTTFMVNHRQTKQTVMPLADGGSSSQSRGRNSSSSGSSIEAQHESSSPLSLSLSAQNTTKPLQQTLKTPRMIQRLVAGHLQNAEGRSTYHVSVVTANSTVSNSSAPEPPVPLYFRRKQPVMSSSFRNNPKHLSTSTTTRSPPVVMTTTPKPVDSIDGEDGRDDDEALLDDPGDFDNWDNGILRLSAGAGKEGSKKPKKNKDDSKKTLADQVRDGKYGLIEKELFRREPKRPGVLSYLPNKEMPYDNERNYGGLNEEDIWLAEDHLLVIKGGSLNDGELNEPWPPIDDYDAPGRQIKIPPNPKVPPPFPVQLEEGGPVQFIGNNKFTVVYPVANESLPVYPVGAETVNRPAESDSDNEKNSVARPGSSADAAKGEQTPPATYVYPAPYPPWLYHNQTFVNPLVSNARPITFPGLGPFPLGRNVSLDAFNNTDYFDEDDPMLYYPPAYSFTYKSNYSNAVPPGPLVPGIVLPPPPNQFSRLEKTHKASSTTAAPPFPSRHRIYATTSTSTSTSSSTTITTPTPYRPQVITKITEYIPKTIIVTPSPPITSTSTTTSPPLTSITKLPPTPPPSPVYKPPSTLPPAFAPVPVPVAVPIPVYPVDNYPTTRPIVTFVPTTPQPISDTLSNSNPIYYEYFEAKKKPTTPASNVIDDFLSTTVKPPTSLKPIKIYATSKRPFKGHRHHLQPVAGYRQHPAQENVVIITPKPEVRYKPAPQAPIFKPRPIHNFEHEVNAIRETLRYYQNQQLRDNNIPRLPKAKAVYEYTFDATKNSQTPVPATPDTGNFQPPTQFDEEPFKPMVTYSPPADDENSFRAIAFDKVDNELPSTKKQPKYQSTTTLVPVSPKAEYASTKGRAKKLRSGAQYVQQPVIAHYAPQTSQPQAVSVEYQTTSRTPITTQEAWIAVDQINNNKQEFTQYRSAAQERPDSRQQPYAERLQLPPAIRSNKNPNFDGYYYAPTQQPMRQNNRFYDEPFQNPERKIVNYGAQPQPQHQQQQQQQQQPQQPIWSLENDTYVNYAPNRPPLNPDAEFINPYHTAPVNPYYITGGRYSYPPPPISHQSTYYAPPQRPYVPPLPPPPPPPLRQYAAAQQQHQQRQQYQQQQQLQQQRQQLPMHRDILVNYRQPLPAINPDSEYINHPHVVRNQANQMYRSNAYRLPPMTGPIYTDNNGGEKVNANYYYLAQKYRRSNNNNNNNNNGDGGSSSGSSSSDNGNENNNNNSNNSANRNFGESGQSGGK